MLLRFAINTPLLSLSSFEVYDSLYLADINGDGYNDLCTDYMIKLEFSQYWVHTYAFYDYHHETYIFKGKPDQYLSSYLDMDGIFLVIKELYGVHDVELRKSEKYLRI